MAECPFCEYEGSTRSVEAHISGSRDEEHSGRLGSNHRGMIQSSVDEDDFIDGDGQNGTNEQFEDIAPTTALLVASAVVVAVVLIGSSGSSGSDVSGESDASSEEIEEIGSGDVGAW